MFDTDKWTEIFSAIARNKMRTALTAFGVFWGILMLVILLGSGNGLKNGVENTFKGFAVNSIYLWPQKTTMPHRGLRPGRWYNFRNGDYDALKAQATDVVDILSPRIQLGGWRDANNVTRGSKFGNFQVMGDYPQYRYIEVMKMENGRYLNDLDITDKRKVCVIGEQIVQELFLPNEEPVGDYIKIKGVYFQVVGIFRSMKGTGEEADQDKRTIYIPYTTFQQAFNFGDRMSWFALTTAPGVSAAEAEKKVKLVLASRHNIAPEDQLAIGSYNAEKDAKKFSGLFAAIRIFVLWIGGLTLLVGAIGVSNIMLIVVNERTREIGIRKALGATPASIIWLIMQESIFLTFMAGYLGLVVGIAILEAAIYVLAQSPTPSPFFLNPSVDFWTAAQAMAILMAAGVMAGLIPAIKAIQVNPIIALRTE